ncbi:MAG TPA: hypothetical protein VN639_16895, partial [Azonexus sp.]|nr:hypothetical protein [Azonexus sp.]
MNKKMIVAAALAALATVAGFALWSGGKEPAAPAVAASAAGPEIASVMAGLRDSLAAYRKIIVLFADEKTLSEAERAQANQVGQ